MERQENANYRNERDRIMGELSHLRGSTTDKDKLKNIVTPFERLFSAGEWRPAVSAGAKPPLKEVVAEDLRAVREASSPESLTAACSALSKTKRLWKREVAIRAFDESTLCAPKDDKRKSAGL
jgi:hypothetical protein